MRRAYLGLDVGSVSANVVAVDPAGEIVGSPVYVRIADHGSATQASKAALRSFLDSCPPDVTIAGAGTTGSGRDLNRHLIGAALTRTEIFAHAAGITHLVRGGRLRSMRNGTAVALDRVGSVIEIGGQDAKLIVFDDAGVPAYFNMNSICSAGTGEFLQQIADEAGIPIGEFGPIALTSRAPARIDATCTVFSKRDFRHLTQRGVPLPDRLWGLCHAMVRNYLRNVASGGAVRPPVVIQGGVAANEGVRRAFESALGTEVIRPPYHDVLGALGMAVIARDVRLGVDPRMEPEPSACGFRPERLEADFATQLRYCHGCHNACELTQALEVGEQAVVVDTLGGRCDGWRRAGNMRPTPPTEVAAAVPVRRRPHPGGAVIDVIGSGRAAVRSAEGVYFAGIDGGSRGTKMALIRSCGGRVEIVDTAVVPTAADAIAALRQALGALRDSVARLRAHGGTVTLGGIGTTGSAGELYRDIISGDPLSSDHRSTEILAHYAWASYRVPNVGTIVDIGGNDTKIICASESGLEFGMNEKCAAGTGAFLEAIGRRFGVPVERYAEVALAATTPARIAARCAVFGESQIVHKARSGTPVPDLLMGLAYSICRTYLADVAKGKEIRPPVVLQGGACLNGAMQRAFRELLDLSGDELVIHADPREIICAGALGAALLARGSYERGADSAFKGFDAVLGGEYRTVVTACAWEGCTRRCPDLVVLLGDGRVISGYNAVDCDAGLFDGLVLSEAARERLLAASRAAEDGR